MADPITLRVAARFQRTAATREHERSLVQPVNRIEGIAQSVVNDYVKTEHIAEGDQQEPAHRDVRPEDVFIPRPRNIGMRNLAETGKDLSQAISQEIPHDSGYGTVSQLSQYLVQTQGGGGSPPVK